METTHSHAGLMSGLARAIFGTVPADAQDDITHGMRHRALRHEKLRAMMQRDVEHATRRHRLNRLVRPRLDD